jgi:hypothetical protein
MNRKRLFLAALIVVLVGAAAVWRFVPGEVPPGQPPLATLDAASLDTLRADFNRHAHQVRVVILLSPT